MNETKKEILKIIGKFLIENPNQRFGQSLFNLNINEFKDNSEEIRDIYNDSDEDILKRLKTRIKQFKAK